MNKIVVLNIITERTLKVKKTSHDSWAEHLSIGSAMASVLKSVLLRQPEHGRIESVSDRTERVVRKKLLPLRVVVAVLAADVAGGNTNPGGIF